MNEPTRAPGLTWRDPVLWLVIGPPLAAVVGGLVTVWIATSYRDPLVTETVRKVGVTWKDEATAPTGGAAGAASVPGAASPTSAAPAEAPPAATPASGPSDDRGG